MNKLEQQLESFNNKIIYITVSGSKLYGTDNANSDTDYKGIFLPSHDDVVLKQDLAHYTSNTNNQNIKNSKDDIDFHLDSIYSFFRNLKKGETGSLDLLFSMFDTGTTMYEDKKYTNILKTHYSKLINRNLHSFVGYCVGQSKKYNIKGNRYKELVDFKEKLYAWTDKRLDTKLDDKNGSWTQLKTWVQSQNYKYIKFTMAKGPKTSKDENPQIEYLEVLGTKYAGAMVCSDVYDSIDRMESQFGQRTRNQTKGVDWKALSHAVRVLQEVEELLDTGFITFPLKNKTYVKEIKEEKHTLESIMDYLDKRLDIVNEKLEKSNLPEKSDEKFMNELLLTWINKDTTC